MKLSAAPSLIALFCILAVPAALPAQSDALLFFDRLKTEKHFTASYQPGDILREIHLKREEARETPPATANSRTAAVCCRRVDLSRIWNSAESTSFGVNTREGTVRFSPRHQTVLLRARPPISAQHAPVIAIPIGVSTREGGWEPPPLCDDPL